MFIFYNNYTGTNSLRLPLDLFDIQPSTFSANPNVKIGLLFNACTCAFFKFLFFPLFFLFSYAAFGLLTNKLLYKYLHVPPLRVTSVQYSFFSFLFFPSSLIKNIVRNGFRNQKSRMMIYKIFFLLYAIIGIIRHFQIISAMLNFSHLRKERKALVVS